jgi:Flp pilus assembly pilin Flp
MLNIVIRVRNRVVAWCESLKDEKGQNTVEYLLMLTVVVGVVLAAGAALKKFMPDLFEQIQGMISSAAGNLGN